tara:strand:+ start:27 stop:356 length:330 start_codon:yes stop_codon:yes gene_type:complete
MELNKKITNRIWDSCAKQIVDGYIFVKMDDIIKLQIENKDLIVDDLETISPKVRYGSDPGDEQVFKQSITDHDVATFLHKDGWIFERNPDTGDIWKRKSGDIHNRTKIN